jgi:2OG-Fe(II) oxygenase superfamily.
LNVVIDFEEEDKSTIGQILDARLGPLLERIYGVSKDSLRTNDMFVVRYDGEGQQSLGMHTDGCHISFNVLLNDDFEGGGTRFHNTKDDSHQDANPKPGNVLINNAMVLHEGLPTTKGTRYILVGFMYVDVKDPWSGVKKHVSWFSTYLSIPWLTVVLKEALEIKSQTQAAAAAAAASRSNRDERNHQGSKDALILSLINEAFWSFYAMGNTLAHDIVSLVREEDADAYIDTLDSSHKNVHDDESHRGVRWFSGQQIHLNWDGSIYSEWQARLDNQGKFHDTD